MDWKFRNDFEYDWCMSALHCVKRELTELKNTRWLIFGQKADTFMEAIVRFLGFADLQLQLGLTLHILVGDEGYNAAVRAFPFAAVENIDLQEDSIPAEYCVYCGYTQKMDPFQTTEEKQRALRRTTKFWKQIARPIRRALCISGSQIYNAYHYPLAAAEGEFQQETGQPSRGFARTAEQLIMCSGYKYSILRPGIILGAGLDMESPVTDLLDRLIRRETVGALAARTKYSMVYITDFLTALIQTAVTDRASSAWNVSSADTSASLLRICELYLETDPNAPEMNVTLASAAHCPNHALDGAKLKSIGWRQLVDLKTMITMEIAARRGEENGLWFADAYHGKLSGIQSCLFQMLCEIDRICKKHGISYFLAGGTLLGAVRHQNFIPWDDDLDVMMLRRDYERFLRVAQVELPEQLFLQTPSTEDGNHYLISKIRLRGTVFSSEYLMRFPNLHNGIFVDVIAQDYTANNPLAQKLHLKLSLLARGLVFKKWSGQKAAAKNRGYVVFDLIKKMISFPVMEQFQHWVLTLFAKWPDRNYLYDSMGMNLSKGVYPARWLSSQVNVTFCGREFPAPVEYDSYLRYLYGEYTQPVPVTRRMASHEVPWVDLGPYAENPDIIFTGGKQANQ